MKYARFHVVIPSLPGYFLSTLPPRDGWSLVNTAHIFNGLMSEVLGYTTYAGHGGDWASVATPFGPTVCLTVH